MKWDQGLGRIAASAIGLFASVAFAVAALPSSYDLNEFGLVTPVKSQGDLGTCWAFSNTTVFQSSLIKQGLVSGASDPAIDLSTWHLATANGNVTDLTPNARGEYDGWGGFNEFAIGYWTRGRGQWDMLPTAGTTPAGGGPVWVNQNALNVYPAEAAKQGQNLAPYVAPPSQAQTHFLLSQSISYEWNGQLPDLTAFQERLKGALMKYGALSVYVLADNDETDRSNPVWYNETTKSADHAVTLVGWDDAISLSFDGQSFTGGWLIQNSWGTTAGYTDPWSGEAGYYWVPFADTSAANVKRALGLVPQFNEHTPTGYEYAPTVIQNQIFAPYRGNHLLTTGNAAGIRTQAAEAQWIPDNSAIGAIGLWQSAAGTTLDLQIYPEWNQGPAGSGLLGAPLSVTLNPDGSGYNLIELPDPLFLAQGGAVYVVVDFGTDEAEPVVVDLRTVVELTAERGSYLGISWMQDENGVWQDLAIADSSGEVSAIFFMKVLRLNLNLDNSDPAYPIDPRYGFDVDGFVETGGSANTIDYLEFEDGGTLNLNAPLSVTSGHFEVDEGYALGTIQGNWTVTVPGAFRKTGDGALLLDANFNVGGDARVSRGDLYIFQSFRTGGSFTLEGEWTFVSIEAGALLSVGQSVILTGGELEIGGTLEANELQLSGGTFTLLPTGVMLINSLNLQTGFLELSGTRNFPGTVTVAAGAELDFLPGAVVRMGAFNLPGGYGYLYPGSTVTVSGPTTVSNGGVLDVNGILTGPSVLIADTGVLLGSGTLNTNLTNQGIVAPGNSPGTLTINGNFTQSPSGTLMIEIAGPANFDRLVVSGTAALAGNLEIFSFDNYAFSYGESFRGFLQANQFGGAFDSVIMPEGLRGRVVEAGNLLTLVIAPVSYTEVAITPNQVNAAAALDAFIPATSGDRLTVSTALDFLTAAEYPAAFDAISPAFYESLASLNLNLIFNQGQQMQQRFRSVQLGRQAGFELYGLQSPVFTEKTLDPKNPTPARTTSGSPWGFWLQGNGIFSNQASVNQVPSYHSSSGGFLSGADYRWSETFTTGLFAGYQGAFANYDGGGRTVLNGARFGGYASYGQATGFFANTMVGGGYTSYTVTRPISFGSLTRTAKSAPGGGDFETLLNLGYGWQLGNFNLGPVASAQYTYLGIAPFTENGADSLDLKIGQQNANSLRTLFGGQIAYLWAISPKWAIIPQASLYWQHEFLQNPRTIKASLDGGSGPAFAYRTATPSRDSVYAGAGVTVQLGDRWNTNFYYNANFGQSDFVSHQITGGIGFSW